MIPVVLLRKTKFKRGGMSSQAPRWHFDGTICTIIEPFVDRDESIRSLRLRSDPWWYTEPLQEGVDFKYLSALEALALEAE